MGVTDRGGGGGFPRAVITGDIKAKARIKLYVVTLHTSDLIAT